MPNLKKYQLSHSNENLSNHLANERTFLAWVRTSVGIMAFGFVVEKFSLFLKEAISVGGLHLTPSMTHSLFQGYSAFFGATLVGLGAILCVLAFFNYKRIERQIETRTFRPTMLLDIMLALSVCLISIFLIMTLIV